jgi:hypothetical protein
MSLNGIIRMDRSLIGLAVAKRRRTGVKLVDGESAQQATIEDLLVVMSRRDLHGGLLQSLSADEVKELAAVTRGCTLSCC